MLLITRHLTLFLALTFLQFYSLIRNFQRSRNTFIFYVTSLKMSTKRREGKGDETIAKIYTKLLTFTYQAQTGGGFFPVTP